MLTWWARKRFKSTENCVWTCNRPLCTFLHVILKSNHRVQFWICVGRYIDLLLLPLKANFCGINGHTTITRKKSLDPHNILNINILFCCLPDLSLTGTDLGATSDGLNIVKRQSKFVAFNCRSFPESSLLLEDDTNKSLKLWIKGKTRKAQKMFL